MLLLSRRAPAIAARAHQAATSPHNDRPEPTEAQKRAGNYAHGHVQVQGLRIAIENPVGSVRSGVTREGKIWRTVLQHHYGRIKGTDGADGDEVDVFIGPYPESELVFVIDQVLDGRFDEHKAIIGATSEAEARAIYLANYQPGWKGLGAITALPMAEFKEWLANHDTRVPMASNHLPPELVFMKADVQRPGSRGGRFWVDREGHIRYGEPPHKDAEKRRLSEADKLRLYEAEQGITPPPHDTREHLERELTDLQRRRDTWITQRARLIDQQPGDHWRETLSKVDAEISELTPRIRWLERTLGSGVAAKADVQNPGSRGGHYYVDHQGHIRYGFPPEGVRRFDGATGVRQVPQTTRRSGLFAGRSAGTVAEVAEIFRECVDRDRERFWMIHLDHRDRATAVECISQGTINQTLVHPREAFKNAVQLGTAAVSFVHNHPSGDPRPSPEDKTVTDRLRAVGAQLGIRVRHSVVVGFDGFHDVDGGSPSRWEPRSDAKRRQLREIEGRLQREVHADRWENVFSEKLQSTYDVAAVGRTLLDPGDQIALVLTTDNKLRTTGVFPLAHRTIDTGAIGRFVRTSIGAGAASVTIVASKDGRAWQEEIAALHFAAKAAADEAGLNYLDTVSVGESGVFRTVVGGDTLLWERT